MKVKDAIKILSEIDQDAELIWHDVIEGNDCEVESLYFHVDRRQGNKEVYVSCCTKEQMEEIFHTGKNLASICRNRANKY